MPSPHIWVSLHFRQKYFAIFEIGLLSKRKRICSIYINEAWVEPVFLKSQNFFARIHQLVAIF